MSNLVAANITHLTLAEKFLKHYSDSSRYMSSLLDVIELFDNLCKRYNLFTKSNLTKHNKKIGTRYIFADKSFCDFYDEAPEKAFTGVDAIIQLH